VTGLARFSDPRLVILVLVLAAWVLRRRAACAVVLIAGIGVGAGSHTQQLRNATCAASLPLGESTFTLHLIDPASGSGRVALPGRCRGVVMARWPGAARLRAGVMVEVRARWLPRAQPLGFVGGMLVVRRVEREWGRPSTVAALRNGIAETTQRLFGPRAAMVDALIVGWRGAVDREVQQAFSASGLVHILSISGFHIGLLAGWVLLVLRLVRVPRHLAAGAAALVAVGYALFLGWPAPAARAALLALALAFTRWRQRHVAPTALLALSACVVLVADPAAIVSVGAWLSVLALAGLTAATRWSDRAIGEHALIRGVSGSIGAMLATAPITAAIFGQVAPIAIVLNLVAVPIAALLVPTLLAAVLLGELLPATAGAFAASGGVLLQALEAVARLGASAPGAGVVGDTGFRQAIPWLAAAGLALWAIRGRTTVAEAGRRLAWGGVAALWLTLASQGAGAPSLSEGRLALVFADVGQGDAALIRTPGGHWIMVDAGPADDRWDAGERVLVPLLRRLGARRLEAIVVSHAHRDHVGGAAAVTAALPVGVALEPGEPFAETSYHTWLEILARRGVGWRAVEAGDAWVIDGVHFRLLHPPSAWPHVGEDLNEDSAVLEVRYREFRALFMGDAGVVAEEALAGSFGAADVLKVGHHGSRTASSGAFLTEVAPQAAVISVGRNRYGHPTGEALGRLAASGARIWRTDREGHITVESDGQAFTVRGASGLVTFTAGRRAGRRRRRAPQFPGHHPRALHPRSGTRPPRRHGGADQPPL
jgi:competence protein ComEC